MKYFLLLIVVLPLQTFSQFSDNFSDGNISIAPAWIGDTASYMVNPQGLLQLNAPAVSGTASLSTSSQVGMNATWNFLVKMDFNPSSANYAKVYLMSDQPDLTLPLNGYYLRIGGTNDDLCLFRVENGAEMMVADGRDKIFNTAAVDARVKATRDETGNWEIFCDTTGGENFNLSATAFDNTIWKSAWFGVQCIYSSTRSTKFYFDDFVVSGDEYVEPKPAIDSTQLFDVEFNEIMVDPTPVAGLPESEYIELYNRTGKSIHMNGWILSVGSSSFTIPDIQISAGGYLVITSKADEAAFTSFGQTLGLFSSSTTLNNAGQYLKLVNCNGRLIDWLEYDDSWYQDDFKSQGGWSLEQIDPWNPCGGKANWKVSTANIGGTPGSRNAVSEINPDQTFPDIIKVNVLNDTTMEVYFTEPMDTISATNTAMYHVSPDIGIPKYAHIIDHDFSAVQLILQDSFKAGKTYNLQVIKNITDCAGNNLSNDIDFPVGIPVFPGPGDVIINEVLFNAKTGGDDYIEIYNRSSKLLNARNLLIGTKSNGVAGNLCRLSDHGFLISPSSYFVISQNCEKVKPFYTIRDDKCFVDLGCMPTLDDKASTIILENDTFGTVDEFSYSESMHSPTLKNLDGISLERVNPDKTSDFPGNWHSAAESSGYGTPGYQNSQYLTDSASSTSIMLSDDIFSPDNDGYRDILQISYHFDKAGCRAQVCIFDAMGRLMRHLLNNELLGTSGSFSWDGTNDAGKLCNVGMYVIFIRAVFDDGTVKEYKKSCVLAMKR